jgi:peptidyl-prolyl cis-trans isomerase B (cyclophilin B)
VRGRRVNSRRVASAAMRKAAVLGLALVVALLAGCGGAKSHPSTSGGCADVPLPGASKPGHLNPPATRLDPAKHWTLTFATSCGTFVVTLQPRISPRATASLVSLARAGFFDHTIFHRIVPGFVVQGGDPTQTGAGGPGYTTVDPPSRQTRYTKWTVAMAKAGADPRGAAGSQFFVMTADAPSLAPDYAVVGRVGSGFGVVARIGIQGDPATEKPLRVITVDHVTVSP